MLQRKKGKGGGGKERECLFNHHRSSPTWGPYFNSSRPQNKAVCTNPRHLPKLLPPTCRHTDCANSLVRMAMVVCIIPPACANKMNAVPKPNDSLCQCAFCRECLHKLGCISHCEWSMLARNVTKFSRLGSLDNRTYSCLSRACRVTMVLHLAAWHDKRVDLVPGH